MAYGRTVPYVLCATPHFLGRGLGSWNYHVRMRFTSSLATREGSIGKSPMDGMTNEECVEIVKGISNEYHDEDQRIESDHSKEVKGE